MINTIGVSRSVTVDRVDRVERGRMRVSLTTYGDTRVVLYVGDERAAINALTSALITEMMMDRATVSA